MSGRGSSGMISSNVKQMAPRGGNTGDRRGWSECVLLEGHRGFGLDGDSPHTFNFIYNSSVLFGGGTLTTEVVSPLKTSAALCNTIEARPWLHLGVKAESAKFLRKKNKNKNNCSCMHACKQKKQNKTTSTIPHLLHAITVTSASCASRTTRGIKEHKGKVWCLHASGATICTKWTHRAAYLSWRCVNSLKAVEEMRTSVTLSASQHPVRRSKLSARAAAKGSVQSNGTSLGALHFKSPSLSRACSDCSFWACPPRSRSDETFTLDQQLKEELPIPGWCRELSRCTERESTSGISFRIKTRLPVFHLFKALPMQICMFYLILFFQYGIFNFDFFFFFCKLNHLTSSFSPFFRDVFILKAKIPFCAYWCCLWVCALETSTVIKCMQTSDYNDSHFVIQPRRHTDVVE